MNRKIFLASSAYLKVGQKRLLQDFPQEAFDTVTTEEFAADLPTYIRRFRTYRKAVFYTYDFDMSRTILWHAIIWWISQDGLLIDGTGRKRKTSLFALAFRDAPQLLSEPILLPYVFSRVLRDLCSIQTVKRPFFPKKMSFAYLRTDYWFGIKAGGSVGHIAGVANAIRDMGIPLFFLSSDRLELIDETRTPLVWVKPSKYIQNMEDAPQLAYNLRLVREANKVFASRRPTIIYQRYSQYNYAGAYLAAKWKIPFVLEYNGSVLWMARHWGSPLRLQRWAEEIEQVNLRNADAIVVVSEPMKDELVARGFEGRKILINPNGVDPDRFDSGRLEVERVRVRERHGIQDRVVVGFIGTFGRWHGAEILARAVPEVVRLNPHVHFLFIGDGVTRREAEEIVRNAGVADHVTFAGMVPQEEGPAYLSACDILASPHVPNPDGTPFFGSPTKLFEYMAMARGIVASNLDQIGKILQDQQTAILVQPGSVHEMAAGILELANSPDKARFLGNNARAKVIAEYTWHIHTQRILDHVAEILS